MGKRCVKNFQHAPFGNPLYVLIYNSYKGSQKKKVRDGCMVGAWVLFNKNNRLTPFLAKKGA